MIEEAEPDVLREVVKRFTWTLMRTPFARSARSTTSRCSTSSSTRLKAWAEKQPAFTPDLRHLMVDPFQDLNECDQAVIGLLRGRTGAEILVAGDDDQSVHGGVRRTAMRSNTARAFRIGRRPHFGYGSNMWTSWLRKDAPSTKKRGSAKLEG